MTSKKIYRFDDAQSQIDINGAKELLTQASKKNSKLQPIKKNEVSGIKKTSNLQQHSPSKLTGPPLSSGRGNYSAIRYRSYDTIRNNKEYDMFEETDETFCNDVQYICEKNKSLLYKALKICSLLQKDNNDFTDFVCDKIDFIARKHYKANRINETYRAKKNQIQDSYDLCPCGCQKYRGKSISFRKPLNQLNFLGSGTLLFFKFLESYAFLMGLVFLIYGIFALTTNFMGGQNIQSENCTDFWCRFTHNSANNNKIQPETMMVIQWWLGVVFTVVWLIATKVIKVYGRIMDKQIDHMLNSASDRAIFIKNLPQGDFTQNELIEYFDRLWMKMKKQKQATQNQLEQPENKRSKKQLQIFQQDEDNRNKFNIQSIQIIYSMKFARKINQKIIQMCKYIKKMILSKPCRHNPSKKYRLLYNQVLYQKQKEELIEFIQIMGDLRKKFFAEENFRKSISGTNCIVIFKTQEDRNRLLETFGKQKVSLMTATIQWIASCICRKAEGTSQLKGNYLTIERAPEPSDILWQNCQSRSWISRTFIIYLASIAIVVVSFFIVFGLETYKDSVIDAKKNAPKQGQGILNTIKGYFSIIWAINLLIWAVLQGLNKIIWDLIGKMIDYEVNYTLSDKISSHMNKAMLFTTLNIILSPLLTFYILNLFGIGSRLYGIDGLNELVYSYQTNILTTGLIKIFFNPMRLLKRGVLYIRWIRNYIIRFYCLGLNIKEENLEKGIKSINQLYEGEQFDVAQNYVDIIGTIYHALFFCQMQPAILIACTLSTLGHVIVYRVHIFFYCSAPKLLDMSVFSTASTQVCLAPLLYGIGSVVLSYTESSLYPKHPFEYYQGLICIGLSLLFYVNPYHVFYKMANYIVECANQVCCKKNIKREDIEEDKNEDTYYQSSNSLTLLGFENILKKESVDQSAQTQLERFCTRCIPKNDRSLNKRKQQQDKPNFRQ